MRPFIKYTVADVLKNHQKLYIFYHAVGTPWDMFSTMGCIVGCVLGASVPGWHIATAAGSGGLIGGSLGMALGGVGFAALTQKGEGASPPWNAEGIEDRAYRLARNDFVRALDLGAWTGILVGGTLVLLNGPGSIHLAEGALGVLQGASIGSAIGSTTTLICTNLMKKTNMYNPLD